MASLMPDTHLPRELLPLDWSAICQAGAARPAGKTIWALRLPRTPCKAPPGSPEKIAALGKRWRRRESLWHPEDAVGLPIQELEGIGNPITLQVTVERNGRTPVVGRRTVVERDAHANEGEPP